MYAPCSSFLHHRFDSGGSAIKRFYAVSDTLIVNMNTTIATTAIAHAKITRHVYHAYSEPRIVPIMDGPRETIPAKIKSEMWNKPF